MRQIVLDTETTGFDFARDKLVEIGAIELTNYSPTGRTFHTYLNPGIPVPIEAQAVHGLTDEFLADKPKFQQIAAEFISFVGTDPIVAHNAAFDMGFLQAAAGHIPNTIIDTLALARKRHPNANNTLDGLCRRYRISTAARTHHGALLDAELLAAVYVELIGRQSAMSLEVVTASAESVTNAVRPNVLPARLTASDLAAHATLAAAIPGSIWPSFIND